MKSKRTCPNCEGTKIIRKIKLINRRTKKSCDWTKLIFGITLSIFGLILLWLKIFSTTIFWSNFPFYYFTFASMALVGGAGIIVNFLSEDRIKVPMYHCLDCNCKWFEWEEKVIKEKNTKTQIPHKENRKVLFNNLTAGNYIIIISGFLFIVSLFLDWASAGGFLFSKGIAFMKLKRSISSGLPKINIFTLFTVIGCVLLCFVSLKEQKRINYKVISIVQIVLSIFGLLPFILLPFELKTWIPPGHIEIGGWLAIVATFGVLGGAILTLIEISSD